MAMVHKKNSVTLEVDIEMTGSKMARGLLFMREVGSFLISLALATSLLGLTYCAIIEVRHLHGVLP